MKYIFFAPLMMIALIGSAQDPPPQITKSFEAQFPNQKVLAWNNNSSYDDEGNLPENVYEGDTDHTSSEAQKAQIKKNEDGYTPYRPEGWRDSVGKEYPQKTLNHRRTIRRSLL